MTTLQHREQQLLMQTRIPDMSLPTPRIRKYTQVVVCLVCFVLIVNYVIYRFSSKVTTHLFRHISPIIPMNTSLEPYKHIYIISKSNTKINLKKDIVVCACAKCGSTTFYNFLYNITFGHEWPHLRRNGPWVQEMMSSPWSGIGKKVKSPKMVKNAPFSFALYRDPQERIISAWKSKITCDNKYHTEKKERVKMTKELLNLSGSNESKACLSFDEYLKALVTIHKKRLEYKLNTHFLPQHLGCFRYNNPYDWTVVTSIEAKGAKCMFTEKAFGKKSNISGEECDFVHTHESGSSKFEISPKQEKMLNLITHQEYIFFKWYGVI